jgi:quercetin dioxygenase-like cupin family protein
MDTRLMFPLASLAIVGLLSPASSVWAQDAVKADPAHYKVLVDNASVRVLKISYPAGEKSVMHAHPDTIVVPLTSTTMQFTLPDGKKVDAKMVSESAQYATAGTHLPTNVGTGPTEALLVEFQAAAPGTAAIPSSRENMGLKTLAEGPRGTAYRVTANPDFSEPAGTKHEYDQVVIALAPIPMSLAIDGKPAKSSWSRGEVEFIGRGVAHGSKNTAGKPADFVIVYVR